MELLELDDPRWLELVEGCDDATAFHHPAWARLLSDCYGYRAFAVCVEDSCGNVDAGVPVLELGGRVRARRWVGLPFTDSCPPLALSAGALAGLARALSAAGRVEVRGTLPGALTGAVAVTHTLTLRHDLETVYRSFSSQTRRSIAKAEREGVTVRPGEDRRDLVETFYGLHVRTRRRLGVPVQPRRFFDLLWERLVQPGLGSVLVAESGGRPVAAAVFLAWNRTVTYKFGASDAEALGVRPNHLLFWTAIRSAAEQGYANFDFGRSDVENEGLRRFKSSWGAVERPLFYSALGGPAPSVSAGRAAHVVGTAIRRSPGWVCRGVGELLYRYAA